MPNQQAEPNAPISQVSERERLAIHEADHSLVAHRIGDTVVEVTLTRGDHHDGATHRTRAGPRDGLTAEQREIIVSSRAILRSRF